jgi:TrmH family RNA methyltransferase
MEILSKNKLKYIRSLKASKFRQKYNNFVVEGFKSIHEFLQANTFEIECLVLTHEAENSIDLKAYKNLISTKIYVATEDDFNLISNLTTPSKMLAVFQRISYTCTNLLSMCDVVFYLDDVQDPGNVGTIIRIADWFGIGGVIRSKNAADFYNPKVVQASMGSFNKVKLATLDEIGEISAFGHEILALDMDGKDVNDFTFPSKCILVMGNEGNGVSEELIRLSNVKLSINGNADRIAESLNVAISAAIVAEKVFYLQNKI